MVKKKREILRLEKERKRLVDELLSDCDLIVGNYSELLVRCGRSGCHCEKKPCHLVARLGIQEQGMVKNRVVRVDDRKRVQQLVQNYKHHKEALRNLKRICELETQILKSVMKLKNVGYV
ncbi:MAG: DUF6788 family protein [Patescibacteria group bacterium]